MGECVVKRLLFVFVALAALSTLAPAKELLNLENGVAIQGYDPVAFFTDNRPVKGNAQFQSDYHGAKYYFALAEHKAALTKSRRNTSRSLAVIARMVPAAARRSPSRSKLGR
jgi:YHS domain-containing protein